MPDAFDLYQPPKAAPDAFDAYVPPPQPTAMQQTMNGPVKGVTGLLGTPSALAHSALELSFPKIMGHLAEGAASMVGHPLSPESTKSVEGFTQFLDTPRRFLKDTALPAVGLYPDTTERIRAPLREMGALPENPNYQAPAGVPRVLDTTNEYLYGAAPAAAMTDGGSLLPSMVGAGSSGVTAGAVRSTPGIRDSKYEPLVEAILASATPLAGRAGYNLATGAGIGPTIKGGTDPITGERQADSRFLSINTDAAAANKAFLRNLIPNGYNAAREARAGVLATGDASTALKRSVLNKDAALDNLDNADQLASGGFLPTSGTVSNDSGLLAIERGVAGQPKVFDRIQNNQAAISDQATSGLPITLQPGGIKPGAAQTAIAAPLKARTSDAQKQLGSAEAAQEAAKNDLQAAKAGVSAPADSSNRASASRNALVSKEVDNQAETAKFKELFGKVDPEAPITFTNTRAALNDAQGMMTANESGHPLIAQMMKTRGSKEMEAAESGKIGTATIEGGGTTTPFREAQGDRRAINDALASNPSPTHAAQLRMVKQGIDADLAKAGESNAALGEANAAFRENAQLHRQGVSGQVTKPGADPALALDQYFAQPQGAKQLAALVKKGAVKEGDVRDWVVSKLASSAGEATPRSVQAFLNKNGETLGNFPAIKSEVENLRSSLAQKTQTSTDLGELVKTKQADLKTALDVETNSQPGKFASTNHQKFMDQNLYGQDAVEKMTPVIKAAQADKTGAAMEGLKNSMSQSLRERVANMRTVAVPEGGTPISNNDLATSMAETTKMLRQGSPTRAVMEQIYSPQEMAKLDQINNQMAVELRRSNRVTTGSNTNADSMAAKMVQSIPLGMSGGTSIRVLKFLGGLGEDLTTKDRLAKYQNILQDATLDPKLAAALLRRESPKAVEQLKKVIGPYFHQAGVAAESAESDQ